MQVIVCKMIWYFSCPLLFPAKIIYNEQQNTMASFFSIEQVLQEEEVLAHLLFTQILENTMHVDRASARSRIFKTQIRIFHDHFQ